MSAKPFMHRIPLHPPADFHFRNTVFSHGWCSLAPFSMESRPVVLTRVLRLSNGQIGECRVSTDSTTGIVSASVNGTRPSSAVRADVAAQLAAILHFDCDLSAFYRIIARHPRHRWMSRRRAGRFLRGATFFEDVVKTILTTNCSWSLTEAMNDNLVSSFGQRATTGLTAFPTPEALADATERKLREQARLGYRAPFVLELARRCAMGHIDIEAFRSSTASAQELHRELCAIKGVGAYAAGNLLRLLGRFDYLALDSWCRSKFSELHSGGNRASDEEIERHYAAFESWKGLVMWLDLTRHWYTEKFPL